jgi:hypothetical protein
MIGINAVNYFNLVPTLSQLIGKSFYKNSISPKIIGGVESGNHAEAERSIHHLLFQKFISKSPLPIVRYYGCVFIKNCKFGSVEATRE